MGLTKMQQSGVIVSATPDRVDFLLRAGYKVVGKPVSVPASEAESTAEVGASFEDLENLLPDEEEEDGK